MLYLYHCGMFNEVTRNYDRNYDKLCLVHVPRIATNQLHFSILNFTLKVECYWFIRTLDA